MNRYHRLPLVPCPTCISRAPWIHVDHTDAKAVPSDVEWIAATPEITRLMAARLGATSVWFNHADPDKATLRRMYRGECDATVFSKRDMRGVGQARKGYQCNGCADREEGTGC